MGSILGRFSFWFLLKDNLRYHTTTLLYLSLCLCLLWEVNRIEEILYVTLVSFVVQSDKRMHHVLAPFPSSSTSHLPTHIESKSQLCIYYQQGNLSAVGHRYTCTHRNTVCGYSYRKCCRSACWMTHSCLLPKPSSKCSAASQRNHCIWSSGTSILWEGF